MKFRPSFSLVSGKSHEEERSPAFKEKIPSPHRFERARMASRVPQVFHNHENQDPRFNNAVQQRGKAATMQRAASTTASTRPVLGEIMNRMSQQQGQPPPPGFGMRKAPTQQRDKAKVSRVLYVVHVPKVA